MMEEDLQEMSSSYYFISILTYYTQQTFFERERERERGIYLTD